MSVWLPRRPPSAASVGLRSVGTYRALHVIALRHNHLPAQVFNQPRQLTVPRRWQSTKDSPGSTSQTSNVPAESKPSSTSVAQKDDASKEPLGRRIWKKVKHEAAHYWNGTKLLVSEVRISARLQWKLLHGETLTRRERRQVRFVVDVRC